MNPFVTVFLKRVRPGFEDLDLPRYQTPGSAGMDLRAAVDSEITILPGHYALIPSGIAVALPTGYEGQVRPRSGLAAKHGVTVLNSPGTIDCDYRGEIQVILINHGPMPFSIQRGDRIAQFIVAPVTRAELDPQTDLTDTSRSSGGFGHTGK